MRREAVVISHLKWKNSYNCILNLIQISGCLGKKDKLIDYMVLVFWKESKTHLVRVSFLFLKIVLIVLFKEKNILPNHLDLIYSKLSLTSSELALSYSSPDKSSWMAWRVMWDFTTLLTLTRTISPLSIMQLKHLPWLLGLWVGVGGEG